MKSQKPIGLSQQFSKDNINKQVAQPSYCSIIKIPLAASDSNVSEASTEKIFALKNNAGVSIVENRMPLRLLLNETNVNPNENVPLILSSLYKKEIYRVDLSQLANNYIGETEKKLDEIFQAAQQNDWILFFDEADALFGKRTQVADSHDKYANQEVSYLLQRIESYQGILLIKCLSPGCLQLSSFYHFKTLG